MNIACLKNEMVDARNECYKAVRQLQEENKAYAELVFELRSEISDLEEQNYMLERSQSE